MKKLLHDLAHGFFGAVVVVGVLLLALSVLAGCSPAAADTEQTYTHAEAQRAVERAVEYGRQIGQAEAAAAIEEVRSTLERCAIARGI